MKNLILIFVTLFIVLSISAQDLNRVGNFIPRANFERNSVAKTFFETGYLPANYQAPTAQQLWVAKNAIGLRVSVDPSSDYNRNGGIGTLLNPSEVVLVQLVDDKWRIEAVSTCGNYITTYQFIYASTPLITTIKHVDLGERCCNSNNVEPQLAGLAKDHEDLYKLAQQNAELANTKNDYQIYQNDQLLAGINKLNRKANANIILNGLNLGATIADGFITRNSIRKHSRNNTTNILNYFIGGNSQPSRETWGPNGSGTGRNSYGGNGSGTRYASASTNVSGYSSGYNSVQTSVRSSVYTIK